MVLLPMAKDRSPKSSFRAGSIALVGRPNVGKSTLLNAILGERLAITSHQPQTTRDRIAGIINTKDAQFVFFDTPGVHSAKNKLGHRMNDVATGTATSADVVVFVVEVGPDATPAVRKEDAVAFATLPKERPTLLVVNKIDRVKEKSKLLEVLGAYGAMHDFAAVVPLTAKKAKRRAPGDPSDEIDRGVARLLKEIRALLPEGPALYPEDELSDKPVRFFVSELVREQVLLRTREEVPHGVAVTVDAYEEGKKLTRITMSVHVAKDSHKGIIIGQGGKMLAAIGTKARERIERLIGQKVHLDIRVKATPGWFDDAARLVDLGYADNEGVTAKPKKRQKKLA